MLPFSNAQRRIGCLQQSIGNLPLSLQGMPSCFAYSLTASSTDCLLSAFDVTATWDSARSMRRQYHESQPERLKSASASRASRLSIEATARTCCSAFFHLPSTPANSQGQCPQCGASTSFVDVGNWPKVPVRRALEMNASRAAKGCIPVKPQSRRSRATRQRIERPGTAYSASSTCRRNPSAERTFITVPKLGFPSSESAL